MAESYESLSKPLHDAFEAYVEAAERAVSEMADWVRSGHRVSSEHLKRLYEIKTNLDLTIDRE